MNEKNRIDFIGDIYKEREKYEIWEYKKVINRPILPMMTHTEWEITKLNNYLFGRSIDINLNLNNQYYIPLTKNKYNEINYKNHNICKQQIVSGMGWMGMFTMFKSTPCYSTQLHHPSTKWFPVAT